MGFRLFVLPKRCPGQLPSMLWRTRVKEVSCTEKPVGVPSCRARRAQPPCCAPPDPTRPWCVWVLYSTSVKLRLSVFLQKLHDRSLPWFEECKGQLFLGQTSRSASFLLNPNKSLLQCAAPSQLAYFRFVFSGFEKIFFRKKNMHNCEKWHVRRLQICSTMFCLTGLKHFSMFFIAAPLRRW